MSKAKHRPLAVQLDETDVLALDAFPWSRHATMIACIRAGIEVLREHPERVLAFNPVVMTKRPKE